MKEITVVYRLSQEGQKKSLLSGGTGEKEQRISIEVTDEQLSNILKLENAEVKDDGEVVVDVNEKAQFILVDTVITSYEELIKAIEEHEEKRKAYDEGKKLKKQIEKEIEREEKIKQLIKDLEQTVEQLKNNLLTNLCHT